MTPAGRAGPRGHSLPASSSRCHCTGKAKNTGAAAPFCGRPGSEQANLTCSLGSGAGCNGVAGRTSAPKGVHVLDPESVLLPYLARVR